MVGSSQKCIYQSRNPMKILPESRFTAVWAWKSRIRALHNMIGMSACLPLLDPIPGWLILNLLSMENQHLCACQFFFRQGRNDVKFKLHRLICCNITVIRLLLEDNRYCLSLWKTTNRSAKLHIMKSQTNGRKEMVNIQSLTCSDRKINRLRVMQENMWLESSGVIHQ